MTDRDIIHLNFELGYILVVFANLYTMNKNNKKEQEKALSRIIQYILQIKRQY